MRKPIETASKSYHPRSSTWYDSPPPHYSWPSRLLLSANSCRRRLSAEVLVIEGASKSPTFYYRPRCFSRYPSVPDCGLASLWTFCRRKLGLSRLHCFISGGWYQSTLLVAEAAPPKYSAAFSCYHPNKMTVAADAWLGPSFGFWY